MNIFQTKTNAGSVAGFDRKSKRTASDEAILANLLSFDRMDKAVYFRPTNENMDMRNVISEKKLIALFNKPEFKIKIVSDENHASSNAVDAAVGAGGYSDKFIKK